MLPIKNNFDNYFESWGCSTRFVFIRIFGHERRVASVFVPLLLLEDVSYHIRLMLLFFLLFLACPSIILYCKFWGCYGTQKTTELSLTMNYCQINVCGMTVVWKLNI